ncbi:uncharacterized protein LOC132197723 [Neocloeon triangulifer]|uniref:uncharacterized protein LOC132197723 n=1 Tax=Neocloeon triangulifer TaxID=2078957 RepID=UPI00286EC27D|nr:uncharacterized protein LOC132197723 [Neocloeon triangulifer]
MGLKNDQQPAGFAFKSMYEVLLDNLQKSRMSVHLYRIIYIAEHKNEKSDALECFLKLCLERINQAADDDLLCALFIHYSQHFILMLEGSEEEILRHLAMLVENAAANSINAIHVLIMLRANQRLLEPRCSWRVLKLNSEAEAQMSGRRMSSGEPWQQARICVDKLHRLAGVLTATESGVSGPLTEQSMIPDTGNLRQVIATGLLQRDVDFAQRLAPISKVSHYDDHIWPPEDLNE